METHTDVLLVTANVGSLFDNVGEIEGDWLREFSTVHKYKPRFIALHFQEVGGKDYTSNMDHAEKFFRTIETSPGMADFDRACVYIDNDFKSNSFTALGSMYYIHKSLKNIQQYDFNVKEFKAVSGCNKYEGSLEEVTTVEKEKFPKNFWPDFKWSRKGYMRTRWIIHNQALDLVNIHLFHDASNLIACDSSPSVYSTNRKTALRYVISRISDSSPVPFFLFGDFNFRLDTLSLVQNLSTSADIQTVKTVKNKDSSNEVEKIIFEEKDNDHKVLLHIETKLFAYLHQAVFRENNGKELLKYDKEIYAFHEIITEEDIQFPPSYPYSEDNTKPTQYMNTRCPAWCDRILMSHGVKDIIHRRENGERNVVYNTLGSNVCMGDHKPVFLCFTLKTIAH
ncbi:inositol polyphosphate-5-phosphatase A [Triplophysa rosa]|uniref:inositol-polyphosphate 5-phosphatase n=1 Tax=Triplophysa rosa TaxID=992332 RepID=A0A9W7WH95_TRIRA|nr:inositol polyphosphate-5-phosphatase A [Triplophysa rosa]KAI7797508.1 type I inositol 1 [Triplophysa rosa]